MGTDTVTVTAIALVQSAALRCRPATCFCCMCFYQRMPLLALVTLATVMDTALQRAEAVRAALAAVAAAEQAAVLVLFALCQCSEWSFGQAHQRLSRCRRSGEARALVQEV